MFEVGDLVKYVNGEAIYVVESVKNGSCRVRHLKSGKVYSEAASDKRLTKLKFRVGDKVKVIDGKYKDNICTITEAYISNTTGNLYYGVKESSVGFMQHLLELVTEETPEFKTGDLVYVDHTKCPYSSNSYKVYQVLSIENGAVTCCREDIAKCSFRKEYLCKFKFQPKDIVQVVDKENMYFGSIYAIDRIFFLSNEIYYTLDNAVGSFKESDLAAVSYSIDTTAGDTDIKIGTPGIKIDKSIFDNIEEHVSKALDAFIKNNNNLKQKENENRLQEEGTPVRGDNQRGSVIHGRRHQATVRVRYQCYEARPRKGGSRIIRTKDQLSTSYRRTYGSKD